MVGRAVDSDLRGIERYTGNEQVARVDRWDEQEHIQSRGFEHRMAEERCLPVCK
jgi:hypothetical protein